jgi:hypothetical protein
MTLSTGVGNVIKHVKTQCIADHVELSPSNAISTAGKSLLRGRKSSLQSQNVSVRTLLSGKLPLKQSPAGRC